MTVNLSFSPGFAGNKVIYTAAGDVSHNNSGWQATGDVERAGIHTGRPVGQRHDSGALHERDPDHMFTFTDTNGFHDVSVANILVNSAIQTAGTPAMRPSYRPRRVCFWWTTRATPAVRTREWYCPVRSA